MALALLIRIYTLQIMQVKNELRRNILERAPERAPGEGLSPGMPAGFGQEGGPEVRKFSYSSELNADIGAVYRNY